MPKSIPFPQNFFRLLLLLALLSGCREKSAETLPENVKKVPAGKITITDDLGRQLEIPAQPKRVLGLAASMTEMLFAVVPDSMIVGRTQVCNYPPRALQKPVVNSFPLDLEGLLALQPDLIFTEDGMTSLETAAKIEELGIPVYFQKYQTVEDVFRGMNDLGRILHQEAKARHLADSLKAELTAIEKSPKSNRPNRVLALISVDPIYVYGQNTLMTDKIRKAGGENALQEVFKQLSPPLTREYILKLNPDVIFGLDPQQMDNTFFRLYPELKKVNAHKTGRIYKLTDDLASRPSPRVVESVREIKAFLEK